MKSGLVELQKSIKGLVVMSADLENIFICIFEGRVPENWLRGNCYWRLKKNFFNLYLLLKMI